MSQFMGNSSSFFVWNRRSDHNSAVDWRILESLAGFLEGSSMARLLVASGCLSSLANTYMID